jgi:hypothetical protein
MDYAWATVAAEGFGDVLGAISAVAAVWAFVVVFRRGARMILLFLHDGNSGRVGFWED